MTTEITEIVLKNKGVLNDIPPASDLQRGELAVAHRVRSVSNQPELYDTIYGVFMVVGKAEAKGLDDKVVRVGNAIVTKQATPPDTLEINGGDRDYTGELWYREDNGQFYINRSGAPGDWHETVPYATTQAKGQVQLASPQEAIAGLNRTKALTPATLQTVLSGQGSQGGILKSLFSGSTYQFFVNVTHPSATDAKDNDGHSPNRPFRSIQRALLEVARRSFRPLQPDNGVEERCSIFIAPGDYPLYNGVGVPNPQFPATGEPTAQQLQGFNNTVRAGITLPRGLSLVGADLRKVRLFPQYVPNRNGSQGRATIFKMTGANFFTNFTVLDKPNWNFSHHNLAAFGFANDADLTTYYGLVAAAFEDPKLFNRLQDSANLLSLNNDYIVTQSVDYAVAINTTFFPVGSDDLKTAFQNDIAAYLSAVIQDLRAGGTANVNAYAVGLYNAGTPRYAAPLTFAVYNSAITRVTELSQLGVINGLPKVDFNVLPDLQSPSNPCQDIRSNLATLGLITTNILQGQVPPALNYGIFGPADVGSNDAETEIVGSPGSNTVLGASPYIFSASLRSVWGMCGIDGDGSQVTGLKSYLAAQFTVISLQSDPSAFLGTASSAGEVGDKRYVGTSMADPTDYRHFGYRVSNDAYAQLVSCFCIGPANHYWSRSGGEFSITNSTSNFGDVSCFAEGFKGFGGNGGAFPQDTGHQWIGIKRPLPIPRDPDDIKAIAISTFNTQTNGILQLQDPVDFSSISPFTLAAGSRVYLKRPDTGVEISALITATINQDSLDKVNVQVGSFVGDWSNNGGILQGSQVYLKRVVDTRADLDKVYRIRLKKSAGSRVPEDNFVFRINQAIHGFQIGNALGTQFWNAEITKIIGTPDEYYITLLQGYRDTEGNLDNLASVYPVINTDGDPSVNFPNENPSDSLTYVAIQKLLNALGISGLQGAVLQPSSIDYLLVQNGGLAQPYTVEFNRPSIIRAGGQTWEYLGYYNYDTAIPQVQPSKVGHDMSPIDALLKRVSKTQTQKRGGRVYATGMDEESNFFLGSQILNLKTGQSTDVRFPGVSDPNSKAFQRLTITQRLALVPGSVLKADGNVQFSSSSQLQFGAGADGVKARLTLNPDSSSFGFARPATFAEVEAQASIQSTDNGAAYVTPASLGRWKNTQRLVSQKSGSTTIYLGSFPNLAGGTNVRSYAGYQSNYWPAPSYDLNNPGLTFAPFRTLQDVAQFCNNNFSRDEVVSLVIAPGKYDITACNFNCGVVINGALGTGQIGRYDGQDAPSIQSVIFYQTTQGLAEFDGLMHLVVNQGITLQGTTNYIANVHFWGTIQAVEDPTLQWTDKVLGVTTSLSQILDASQARYTGNGSLFNPSMTTAGLCYPRIYLKPKSDLTLQSCTFGPHGPVYSTAVLVGGIQTGCSFYNEGGKISFSGCRIRGNEKWSLPISRIAPNSNNASWILQGANYVQYGHSNVFIGLQGEASVGFGSGYNHVPYGPINSNVDLVNLRLERNWSGLYGTQATRYDNVPVVPSIVDQGNDNLGSSLTITSGTTESQILGQGPLVKSFIMFSQPLTLKIDNLSLWPFYRAPEEQTQGWKGKFGTLPVVNTYAYSEGRLTTGLEWFFAEGFLNVNANFNYTYTFWKRAGKLDSSFVGARQDLNVDAIAWPKGSFGYGTTTGSYVPYVQGDDTRDPAAPPSGTWQAHANFSALVPTPNIIDRKMFNVTFSKKIIL